MKPEKNVWCQSDYLCWLFSFRVPNASAIHTKHLILLTSKKISISWKKPPQRKKTVQCSFFRYQDAICLSNIFTYVLYVQKN